MPAPAFSFQTWKRPLGSGVTLGMGRSGAPERSQAKPPASPEGREGVQPLASVPEVGGLWVAVPGAVETLRFAKQENRARFCSAYAQLSVVRGNRKKPRLFGERRCPLLGLS